MGVEGYVDVGVAGERHDDGLVGVRVRVRVRVRGRGRGRGS